MKMQVNKNVMLRNLEVIFVLIPFFEPSYFRNISVIHSVYSILRIAICGFVVLKCIRLKVEFLKNYLIFLLYFVCQIFSTMYNGGSFIDEIKADLYIIVPCLYVGMQLSKGKKEVLNSLCIVMGGILLIQAVSIFLFPEGLYVDETYQKYPYWFWNSAGHMSSLAFAYAIILKICEFAINKNFRYLFIGHIILYGFLFGLYFKDYGNFFGFLIIISGHILAQKRRIVTKKLAFISWFSILLLNVGLVFFNIQNIFSWILEDILGKDITLGGRTFIWKNALPIIQNNFWIGKGEATYFGIPGWSKINLTGNYYAAHNQLLNVLLNGGIITLIAFLLIEYIVILKIERCKNNHLRLVLLMGVLGIFVSMLTDTLTPLLPIFILFTVILNISKLTEQKKSR